jgi:hypothetical protein
MRIVVSLKIYQLVIVLAGTRIMVRTLRIFDSSSARIKVVLDCLIHRLF